ncbi:hypothetical protein Leryth_013057 [Lithospermum erythrorhizon]|nr:hypothetical protein Leryth_013057 [Lithospermum erythrorhizon]
MDQVREEQAFGFRLLIFAIRLAIFLSLGFVLSIYILHLSQVNPSLVRLHQFAGLVNHLRNFRPGSRRGQPTSVFLNIQGGKKRNYLEAIDG